MTLPLRVLIVEDRVEDLELILHELRTAGFAPAHAWATTEAEYLAQLGPGLDLVLSDYSLPQFDALRALDLLRARGLDVPFIVVSGSLSEEAAVDCMRRGAVDYLLKDRLGRLGPAVARALEEGRAARALRESERRYRHLVEHSLGLICTHDLDGVLLTVNAAAARLLGYTPDDLVGRPLTTVLGPAGLAAFDDYLVRIRQEGTASGLMDVVSRSGEQRVFLYRNSLYEEPGQAPYVLGHAQDVTDRIRAEQALRQESDILELIASGTPLPAVLESVCSSLEVQIPGALASILLLDPDGLHLRHGAAPRLPAEWVQAIDGVAIGPSVGSCGTAAWRRAPVLVEDIATDPLWADYRALAAPHGFAACWSSPALAGDGSVLATSAVYFATPRAPAAHEARALERASRLASLAIERTRSEARIERQRAALSQTEKVAAMGQLLAGVAHELNNPLSVVKGYAAMLVQRPDPARSAAWARKIDEAADRCTRIVKNFLALARQHPPEREDVDLARVVREAVELLAYPLRADGVETELALGLDVPPLWADPHQLHQVLVNLVANAHQALRAVPPPRRIRVATRVAAGHPVAVLEVADNGPGVPLEVRPRLFEPFFTTKPIGEGTGLGLSLCQGIVEAHGGTIRLEPRAGEGAVFVVELPLAPRGTAGPAAAAVSAEPPPAACTILVVDDEPEVAGVLAEMLAADGHRVEIAAHGREALQRLDERSFDLVLSDLRMPELDGPGLYRELARRRPELLGRLLVVTGDSLDAETGAFLDGVPTPRVAKPFTAQDLRRALRAALGAAAGGP